MKLYSIHEEGTAIAPRWHAARVDAQRYGKDTIAPPFRGSARLRECIVSTDKANMLKVLNLEEAEIKVLRTWKLSNRGGLVLME